MRLEKIGRSGKDGKRGASPILVGAGPEANGRKGICSDKCGPQVSLLARYGSTG